MLSEEDKSRYINLFLQRKEELYQQIENNPSMKSKYEKQIENIQAWIECTEEVNTIKK